jgi:hypothetical protein
MPYVTSIERLAYEQGRREREEEGRRRMLVWIITDALEIRFGVAGKRLVPRVRALTALDKLRALNRAVLTAESLDEVNALLRSGRGVRPGSKPLSSSAAGKLPRHWILPRVEQARRLVRWSSGFLYS